MFRQDSKRYRITEKHHKHFVISQNCEGDFIEMDNEFFPTYEQAERRIHDLLFVPSEVSNKERSDVR